MRGRLDISFKRLVNCSSVFKRQVVIFRQGRCLLAHANHANWTKFDGILSKEREISIDNHRVRTIRHILDSEDMGLSSVMIPLPSTFAIVPKISSPFISLKMKTCLSIVTLPFYTYSLYVVYVYHEQH